MVKCPPSAMRLTTGPEVEAPLQSKSEERDFALASCQIKGVGLPADVLLVVVMQLMTTSFAQAVLIMRVSKAWRSVVRELKATGCGMFHLNGLLNAGASSNWGSAPGQLREPHDCVVLSDGDVIVSDFSNNRLQRYAFCPAAASLSASNGWQPIPLELPALSSYTLYLPTGLAVGPADEHLFVADMSNRVQRIELSSGRVLCSSSDHLCCPFGLALVPSSPREMLAVCDSGNNRIALLYADTLAHAGAVGDAGASPSDGSDDRRLRNPTGVAFYEGELYVADQGNKRVSVYSASPPYAFARALRAHDRSLQSAGSRGDGAVSSRLCTAVASCLAPSTICHPPGGFVQQPSGVAIVNNLLAVSEDSGVVSLLSPKDGHLHARLEFGSRIELLGGMAACARRRMLFVAAKSAHVVLPVDMRGWG